MAVSAFLLLAPFLASAVLALRVPVEIQTVVSGVSGVAGRADNGLVSAGEVDSLVFSEFEAFKANYGRKYGSPEEEASRLRVFRENWKLIAETNAANGPYQLAVNKFADMSWQEFRRAILAETQNCSAQTPSPNNLNAELEDVPEKKNWKSEGIVSPVKNQGHCGSCWTFSTTGALEAAYTQKYGKPVSLSEQQLVDCAGAFKNFGCGGGLPSQAYEYVHYNHGLDTEEAYPYTAKNEKCHFNPDGVGVQVADVFNITQFDENQLQAAVGLVRPTSVAFQVVNDFRFYKSGVYQSSACGNSPDIVNHAVLAVGYDTIEETPYWLIKNSWGAAWGDEGYFKMKLGCNMCGIATCASYPIVV